MKKFAKINIRTLLPVLFAFLISGASGCGFFVYDEGGLSNCVPDQEQCGSYCNTVCDLFGCWDECTEECEVIPGYCEEVVTEDPALNSPSPRPTPPRQEPERRPDKRGKKGGTELKEDETTTTEETICEGAGCMSKDYCFNDKDCNGGNICVATKCVPPTTKRRGESGLCQVCETSEDCSERGAECIQINYDRVTKTGERICSRKCEVNVDCPIGMECIRYSEKNYTGGQCVPVTREVRGRNIRSCASNTELQCVRATDCSAGQSCRDNRCVSPTSAECVNDKGCTGGKVCSEMKCVEPVSKQVCVGKSDCASNENCLNGQCVLEGSEKTKGKPKGHKGECVFASDCGGDPCVDGVCERRCRTEKQCGFNQLCNEGRCQPIECRFSADCSQGEICVNALCKSKEEVGR